LNIVPNFQQLHTSDPTPEINLQLIPGGKGG